MKKGGANENWINKLKINRLELFSCWWIFYNAVVFLS